MYIFEIVAFYLTLHYFFSRIESIRFQFFDEAFFHVTATAMITEK